MNNNMTDITLVKVEWNTNQKVKQYVLLIEGILHKSISANIAIKKLIAFADQYPDLFKKFIESKMKEEEKDSIENEE